MRLLIGDLNYYDVEMVLWMSNIMIIPMTEPSILSQDVYGNITITVKCEIQSTQRAGVVKLRKIDLIGEVGGIPVALLG